MKPEELETEIIRNKADIQGLELKLKALISLLSREGLIVENDVTMEFEEILNKKE